MKKERSAQIHPSATVFTVIKKFLVLYIVKENSRSRESSNLVAAMIVDSIERTPVENVQHLKVCHLVYSLHSIGLC